MPSVRVGQTEIAYDLRRSATASERRITVTPGAVEVMALTADSDADIDAFVCRKRAWLFKAVRELDEITVTRAVVPRFMTGSKIPFRGRKASLVVRRTDGPHIEIDFRGRFLVDLPEWVTAEAAEAVVATELKLWLKRRVRRDAMEIARAYGRRFDLKPRAVRVGDLASGWGSCGAEGTLHINWLLVFAPKRVLEYVVVHEMAHLQQRSHGPAFWTFLGQLMPDYAEPKAWLDAHQGSLSADFLKV